MGEALGGILGAVILVYLATCAVIAPMVAVSMAWEVRDCRLVSGEDCRWHLIPDSKLTGDEWGGGK